MIVVLKILKESLRLVFHSLRNSKLRAFLSLFGITIGIYCIITVLSGVDSLERNIQSGLDKIGSNVVYVQKWPWGGGDGEYAWWEYLNRPTPNYSEYKILADKLELADAVVMETFMNSKTIKYDAYSVRNIDVAGVTADFDEVYDMVFEQGRWFSQAESRGVNVVVIGATIREELFPANVNPIGKMVRLMGKKLRVVGVLEKEGESMVDISYDEVCLLPFEFMRRMRNMNDRYADHFIMVKPVAESSNLAIKDEIIPIMRAARRLKPLEKNDFALNEMTIITNMMKNTFQIFNLIGWIIGGFSILVGGFGIANIMFVTVKDRTNEIGLKKALGAKNHFILIEFLLESVILCLIGCAIGLLLVALTLFAVEQMVDFEFVLSTSNVVLGVSIATTLGVIFGFIPAYMASKMDPVSAIRS